MIYFEWLRVNKDRQFLQNRWVNK